MSYIPSDFDNLNEGLNILNVVENSEVLPFYEGSFSDKGLGYKQQYSLYGDLTLDIQDDPTHLTMDFCYIFKDYADIYPGTPLNFKLQVYGGDGGEGVATLLQEIDLTNYTKTITEDSDGNVVWLYEGFNLNSLTILNNLSGDTIFTVEFYIGHTNPSRVYVRGFNSLCSFNRNGIWDVPQSEMPIVLKWITKPIISFSVERKDPLSDILLVSFNGTFDNSYLGARYNLLSQIDMNYVNPISGTSSTINFTSGTDYTISGNTFYSGNGSSMEAIEVDLQQFFAQGITFDLFVGTSLNYNFSQDDTIDNSPIFNWGNEYGTRFFNVNGQLRVNNRDFLNDLFATLYPVGAIYITDDVNFNPANVFGGTWERIKDAYLVANGDVYGYSGGSRTHTHSIPNHNHGLSSGFAQIIIRSGNQGVEYNEKSTSSWTANYWSRGGSGAGGSSGPHTLGSALGGTTDNKTGLNTNAGYNEPPYRGFYVWKCTGRVYM